jgi:cytosine/adenosine deaminase-related metal-dependent hydrolase
MIRYHARWVLPITRSPVSHGTVAVAGSRIAYVGPRAGAPPGEDADLGDAVIIPGLVNTHTHLELTAMRGFLEDLAFRDWLLSLQRAKQAVLTPDMYLDAARFGIVEGLRAGITTFADSSDSGVTLHALREMRVRGVMYLEVHGPDHLRRERVMGELRARIRELRPYETDLQRLGISPHSPYSVHPSLLRSAADYAMAEHLPMAIHLAESEAELQFVCNGRGPFAESLHERLIDLPPTYPSPVWWLGEAERARPLLIHCVQLDPQDIAMIKAMGCPVAHCPISNAKLGNGIAPLMEMLEAGVTVGLGTDSMASNNRMDLLEEARVAALMQRVRVGRSDVLSAGTALELATIGGARALSLGDRIGSLEVGKEADLAVFALGDAPGLPSYDPAAALIYALGGAPAKMVTVAGEVRVWEGRVLWEDPALLVRVNAIASALRDWRAEQSRERQLITPPRRAVTLRGSAAAD